ncbi:hypothetical protein F5148DRAFT_980647 [Russula earlei]|uniref:Uncharacterized protein n=1 Tax=Russula earlei TaxID=71964 RepID=A0ACC0U8A7_9AGAM|nr:hypothetical protein F5148DRAFT_980647 [Russula earlei]
MIVVLAILAATRASPVGEHSTRVVTLDQLQARSSSCDDPEGCRSLWDIIRSCAVIILLCTWFAVHPNIPSPNEKWPRVTLRRVGLMLAALFVPEIMIAWALKQRQAAAELAERHKEEGWTITHGFFAIMGGFMAYEGNQPVRVLLPEELGSYSLTGYGDFPRIAKEEIEDRSKGDAISKLVVVLQTAWFVTQCVARAVRGLPVTELELATVAFASLNFVLYLMWWNKPLHVQRGVRVYKKRDAERPQPIDDGPVGGATSDVGFWGALRDALAKDLPAAIRRGPSHDVGDMMMWPLRVCSWPIEKPFEILFGEEDYGDPTCLRVNTFYPGRWAAGGRQRLFALATVTAVTLVFGAIHCIGWSLAFPSGAERILWRIAAISITAIPVVGMPCAALVRPIVIFLVPAVLILQYMFGRLTLLMLPLLGLRSLSPAAFHVVHWTSFIPHL